MCHPKPGGQSMTHRLDEAKNDVCGQTSYLFHQSPDESDVILNVCSGDYWTN
jgi:hypothetical protein